MNIWSKIITALRGGATEVGESIVDSQALRILDQEIRDAAEELNQSKDGLASIIAQHKLAGEKIAGLKKDIAEHEGYVLQALEKSDEELAQQVAQKVADLENTLATEESAEQQFSASADNLRAAIKGAENNLKRLKQQVDTVKATENVQRAQEAVAERHSGSNSKVQTALESLERIQERQKMKAAKMSAADELAKESDDSSLQTKLEEAGIVATGPSASDVLARVKKQGGLD